MGIRDVAKFALSVTFLLVGCATSEFAPAAGEAERVYAALLAERHDGADSLFLLIQRETVDGNQPLPPVDGGVAADYTELAHDSLSALEDETLNSFKSGSSRQVRIDSIPGLEIPHALRFSSLLAARPRRGVLGVGVPSEVNPTGIVHLSPVGFNRAGTQALVYAEYYGGNPCGYGEYALLIRVDGRWRISDSVIVFVS
jgi:hypothetical protein